MSVPNLYAVYSPEYQVVAGDVYNPPEFGCDYLEVWAHTKRQAVTLAGLWMRSMNRKHWHNWQWVGDNVSDGLPPWTGLKAKEIQC